MRNIFMACVASVLLFFSTSMSQAQSRSAQLNEVTRKIERMVQGMMPGWKREAITPMAEGDVVSDLVAVDLWTYGDLAVKISILSHSSKEEASNLLNRYPHERGRNKVEGLGDEACTLNDNEILVFRKQNLTIYVAEIGTVLPKKSSELAKKFAHLLDAALAAPGKP